MSRLTVLSVSQNPVDAGLAKTKLLGDAGVVSENGKNRTLSVR
ncbi:hypothetical protein [Xylella fastidiosa]